jgi:threonine aldolase
LTRSNPNVIDLRSDTVTRPNAAMRAAIAGAEVGDDVFGDDPTAAELERMVADLLDKESALFFPSGTMANQAALLIHTRPGTEVVVDAGAHVLHFEEGGAAAWAGVQLQAVRSDQGVPDPDSIAAAIRRPSRYEPQTVLVCLENTHNTAGGRVVPVDVMAAVSDLARDRDLRVHLDGARLPNAAVATGRKMGEWAALADTVMVSLSKGLGAPVGSMLAGPAALMEDAWRIRRRLGGGMRQVGILAAAGLYALRHNIARLADDHRRARDLAHAITELPGFTAAIPDTNIVMIDVDPDLGTAREIIERLDARAVLATEFGDHRLRAVTHLDVDDAGIETAVHAFGQLARPPRSVTA